MEIDDSEVVQTARKAKELLDRLEEYKPLAKVEELTEQVLGKLQSMTDEEFAEVSLEAAE